MQRAFDEIAAVFNDVEDPYLHERKGDLHDVAGRLRMNLRGEKGGARDLLQDLDSPCVLIADELTPSVVAQLDWTRIRGFATDAGSRTYHTAILARSLGVPAVVGLHDVSRRIPAGRVGDHRRRHRRRRHRSGAGRSAGGGGAHAAAARRRRRARATTDRSQTSDGVRIVSCRPTSSGPTTCRLALASGAEGIGLYRSEFMLVGGPPDMAGEDEQYHVYRQLVGTDGAAAGHDPHVRHRRASARAAAGRCRARRALVPRCTSGAGHAGLRGIRFGLAQPSIFKTQLRALLRAAAHGPLRIMFPFVSSVQEVRAARALLAEARAELDGARHRRPARCRSAS